MKTLLVIISMFICITLSSQIKVDANGNYVSTSVGRTKGDTINTGKTYTDSKGVTYPVFKSASGKLYYPRFAKTSGNYYRYYLKVN